MISKFKNSKGTCDYLTVGGVRVPSRNVLITITDSNGNVRSSSISAKSKGNKGTHTTPSKLKKMLKNNPGMIVTAQVKVDEGSAHALSASMVFDPSRCRGKDVDGTASIDEAWSDAPDVLWDVALKGVSYGKYKGNIRQMKWLIENGKGIEGISSVIITPNTYSPHPSAEIITMALIDYIDAGHTLPGDLGAMLTSDAMLLPPDVIKRAQTLGYGNTINDRSRVAQFVNKVFGAHALLWDDVAQGLAYASGKASGKASAKEQWAAKLAAGRCPVCDGKPYEIILMSGNTGCIDCASTGKASVYTSRRVGKK